LTPALLQLLQRVERTEFLIRVGLTRAGRAQRSIDIETSSREPADDRFYSFFGWIDTRL
jgi:hypothetical protein